MSTFAHNGSEQENIEKEGDDMLKEVRMYLEHMVENVEDVLLLSDSLESINELVLSFQEMYKSLRIIKTSNSSFHATFKKEILSTILDASIELSIAHDLLVEEGKKTPQFYQHLMACLEGLQQGISYTEEKAATLRTKHNLLEEKISSNNFVHALITLSEDIAIWQEELYEEYRYIDNKVIFFNKSEKIVYILQEMLISLHKLCVYMGRNHTYAGDLEKYYRLHIVLCYQEQQVEKLLNDISKLQARNAIDGRKIYKLLHQTCQSLEDILLANKSIPGAIDKLICTKTTWKQQRLSDRNHNLRLIAP